MENKFREKSSLAVFARLDFVYSDELGNIYKLTERIKFVIIEEKLFSGQNKYIRSARE